MTYQPTEHPYQRPCMDGPCTAKGMEAPSFCVCKAEAAEIEQLRAQRSQLNATLHTAVKQRDKAEKSVTAMVKTEILLRAEIARLQAQVIDGCELATKLGLEIERLRAALQSIADQCDDEDSGVLIRIAERALANEQERGR